MRYQDFYQFALLFFAFLVLLGVGVFVYHELFPQYKVYQNIYKDLELFRAGYTGEAPAPFSTGIKQILIPNDSGGPEVVDRCISCHVALDLPHFSPTRVARDLNENVMIDSDGNQLLEPNPEYVWAHLDQRIDELRHPVINGQLSEKEKQKRLTQAQQLEMLKTEKVDGREVDVEKVIQMHPLIGAETRPFQYHPTEEYGCTSCHSGNGQALVAKRAHGPVYDEEYEPAFEGYKPKFTEEDSANDPRFAKMYNDKPGHDLVFQTTPILAGDLIVAKCVQCHQSTKVELESAIDQFSYFTDQKKEQIELIEEGLKNDQEALISLLELHQLVEKRGKEGTKEWLNEQLGNFTLSSNEIDSLEGQLKFVKNNEQISEAIEQDVKRILGAEKAARELLKAAVDSDDIPLLVQSFLKEHDIGLIAQKQKAVEEQNRVLNTFTNSTEQIDLVAQDQKLVQKMHTNVDRLISNYSRGKELFVSQACYACHRIAGFSRSSVGPELTKAGLNYPWFIKESIVWPQADLPSSTMPNFRLDHEELSDLMTFLMAQRGETKAISEVDYSIRLSEWDKGAKMPWEEPVAPSQIKNVKVGQLVYATQGCAACHRLQGFESTVGFAIEKKKETTALEIVDQKEWFKRLFPDQIPGSVLAKRIEMHADEIDNRIVQGVRTEGILEEIEAKYPDLIEGFYTNFKYASRAFDTDYQDKPQKLAAYKERLHRVLMVFIQEYGLGREIAPHLDYSGIYRDNAWLLGHFHNPSAYTAKSIMPVMPFDNTKFYMLNHMLHVLGRKNRDALHEVWRVKGFNPALAYETLCSACHGEQRQGNGIVSEWIYPIPKNLRNPIFLRNLTKERAIDSITHGVRGTPMPPWGEAISPFELGDLQPILSRTEIVQLVDWLYRDIPYDPRHEIEEEQGKWEYDPDDVIVEMETEKNFLPPAPLKGEDKQELVHEYFEARPNPIPGPDKELYYIRDKYYTSENLAEAKQFFDVNCATCHGKEGTGTGLRASSMVEAKPRMFTNLPWIRTRDDLRLMRSIKYGVSGTSMIPWGDQTTAAQRMQLVMFIRELTRIPLLRNELEELLYDQFNSAGLHIEEARASEYAHLEQKITRSQQLQQKLLALSESEDVKPETLGEMYTELVSLKKEIEAEQQQDSIYQKLLELIHEQRELYATLGAKVIAATVSEPMVHNYFEIVRIQSLAFTFKEDKLILELPDEEKADFYLQAINAYLDEKIAGYQTKIDHEIDKIRSPERGKKIQELMNEQGTFINLKTSLAVGLTDAKQLQTEQLELFKQIENQNGKHANSL